MVETKFIKRDQLEKLKWGQLYLKDKKFYDKISELISKEEGKKIELLQDSDP